MKKCWDSDRRQRPSASECLATLQHELSVFESQRFDIFFSHPWAKKPFLSHLFSLLHKRGFRVWYDVNDMGYDLTESMRTGVERSFLTVACIDSQYQVRDNCLLELDFATQMKRPIVAVVTESGAASWVQSRITTIRDKKQRAGLKAFYDQSVRENTCVDLGALAALPGWEEGGGGNTTEDMIKQLEAGAEPLLRILERLKCTPSMAVA